MKELISFLFLLSVGLVINGQFADFDDILDRHRLDRINRKKAIKRASFSLRVNDVDDLTNGWIEVIAVDSFNHSFACGYQNDQGFLRKYNDAGDLLWKKTTLTCDGMTLDSNQNVYIVGYQSKQVSFRSFDNNGNPLLSKLVQVAGEGEDLSSDILVDYPYIFITGWTTKANYLGTSSIGRADGFLSKFYAVDGAHISTVRFGSEVFDPNAEEDDDYFRTGDTNPRSLAMDSEKNIYAVGTSFGNFMGETNQGKKDIFLVKINSSSNSIVYSKLYGTAQNDFGFDLLISDDKYIHLVGSSRGSFSDFGSIGLNTGNLDVVFSKIHASNGSVVFHHLFGTASDDAGLALVAHPQDSKRLFISGVTGGDLNSVPSLGHDDAFVVEVNDDGVIKQTTVLGSPGIDSGLCLAVQYKGQSPFLLVGGFNNSHEVSDEEATWLEGDILLASVAVRSEHEQEQDTCSTKLTKTRQDLGKYAKKYAAKRSSARSLTYIGDAIESVTAQKLRPFPKSKGKCRSASSAGNQRSTLLRLGFEEIPKATRNGDIAVFSCVKGHSNGHIQMLYQKKWYSDYAQKSWAPWKDLSGSKVKYYRYTRCEE